MKISRFASINMPLQVIHEHNTSGKDNHQTGMCRTKPGEHLPLKASVTSFSDRLFQ